MDESPKYSVLFNSMKKGTSLVSMRKRCLILNMKDEKLALHGVRKGILFLADLESTSRGELK